MIVILACNICLLRASVKKYIAPGMQKKCIGRQPVCREASVLGEVIPASASRGPQVSRLCLEEVRRRDADVHTRTLCALAPMWPRLQVSVSIGMFVGWKRGVCRSFCAFVLSRGHENERRLVNRASEMERGWSYVKWRYAGCPHSDLATL